LIDAAAADTDKMHKSSVSSRATFQASRSPKQHAWLPSWVAPDGPSPLRCLVLLSTPQEEEEPLATLRHTAEAAAAPSSALLSSPQVSVMTCMCEKCEVHHRCFDHRGGGGGCVCVRGLLRKPTNTRRVRVPRSKAASKQETPQPALDAHLVVCVHHPPSLLLLQV
jgi:hypothetical protein